MDSTPDVFARFDSNRPIQRCHSRHRQYILTPMNYKKGMWLSRPVMGVCWHPGTVMLGQDTASLWVARYPRCGVMGFPCSGHHCARDAGRGTAETFAPTLPVTWVVSGSLISWADCGIYICYHYKCCKSFTTYDSHWSWPGITVMPRGHTRSGDGDAGSEPHTWPGLYCTLRCGTGMLPIANSFDCEADYLALFDSCK